LVPRDVKVSPVLKVTMVMKVDRELVDLLGLVATRVLAVCLVTRESRVLQVHQVIVALLETAAFVEHQVLWVLVASQV